MASSCEDTLQNTLEKVTTYLMSKCHEDEKQSENLCRVLFFVQKETEGAIKHASINPVTKYIANLIETGNEKIFEMYIQNVINDTKTAESNPEFKKFMSDLYTAMNSMAGLKEANVVLTQAALASVPGGMLRGTTIAFARMSPKVLSQVLVTLEGLGESYALTQALAPVLSMGRQVVKSGGKAVVVALVAVELSYEALNNIRLWWKGEISGKFCVKRILDAFAGVGGGVGGGVAGAKLGAMAGGHFGAITGAIAGSIAGQLISKSVMEEMTCKIFDVPKTAALDNAYRYLNISHGAPNQDVNHAYRQKALITHPDKGGKAGDFYELQLHMSIIKVARGDIY